MSRLVLPPHHAKYLSIRWKLTLLMVLIATLVSVSLVGVFSFYDAHRFLDYTRIRLNMIAEIVGNNSSSALKFRSREDAEEVLSSLRAEKSIRSAYILDNVDSLFAEYIREGEGLAIPLKNFPSGKDESMEANSYSISKPILVENQKMGSLYITSDLAEIDAQRKRRFILGGTVTFVFFIFSLGLAIWFQRFFTDPIRNLAGVMNKITSTQDYSFRASKISQDEFGILVDGFNYMVSEIEKREKDLANQMLLLERSNRELDQFVYIASHDLKAPLRAVDNLANLIAKATKDLLPADKREYIDLMHSRIKRMEALFDDLLAYSRVGRTEVKLEVVNTVKLVEGIAELLDPPKPFRIVADPSLPTLETYRTPLEQVFRNLIGNAVKHHNKADGEVRVLAINHDNHIEFIVSDNGPGIPVQYHEKIFQMFQTLKPRDQVEGSGMGLAIVKKIVERQRGKVWIDSTEGEGSSFHFTWLTVHEK